MKKKITAYILALGLLLPLVGCGSKQDVRLTQCNNYVYVYTYNGHHPTSVVKTETPNGYTITITVERD